MIIYYKYGNQEFTEPQKTVNKTKMTLVLFGFVNMTTVLLWAFHKNIYKCLELF